MASTAENIREGLASALSAVTGAAQTAAYNLPNGFTTPCLFVLGNGPIAYDATFGRGTDTLSFTVRGITGNVDTVGSQKLLSVWVSGAVKDGIEDDRTLGGLVDDLRVTDYSGDQYANINGVDYVFGDWTVDVIFSP